MLKGFLVELKNRDIMKYPDSLKATSDSLLLNTDLLNIYITILFKKTK